VNVEIGEVSETKINVAIVGEVDADNCADMGAELLGAGPDAVSLDVDVSALGFIDSSGISELLRVREIKVAAGASMTLLYPTDSVSRVLEIPGLSETFGLWALRPRSGVGVWAVGPAPDVPHHLCVMLGQQPACLVGAIPDVEEAHDVIASAQPLLEPAERVLLFAFLEEAKDACEHAVVVAGHVDGRRVLQDVGLEASSSRRCLEVGPALGADDTDDFVGSEWVEYFDHG